MPLEIPTMQDLAQFKHAMLEEIQTLLNGHTMKEARTLKSAEVCKMLRITPATLQHMRKSKIINATKISGTFYYLYDDIIQMLPRKKEG
jgi:hypothetical protein